MLNAHSYPKTGIYHYSNEGVCSWYDFATMIAQMAGNTDCKISPCHSNEFPSPVKRPAYSVLDKTKIKETFGIEIPYWVESLKQCLIGLKGFEQWAVSHEIWNMRDFHKLMIWQRSHRLTLEIYKISKTFPKSEIFGLTSQIRRAVSSIPTNIAEGCGRNSSKEFAHFLQIAIGSATEVEYQLLLAHDINYINDDDYQVLTNETVAVRKMIIKYQSELKSSSSLETHNSQL